MGDLVARGERVDFAAFVAARGPVLLRSAVFLAGGDVHRGEDMLQTVLARAYPRWSVIASEDPEPYLRRALLNLATDWWRSPLSRVAIGHRVSSDPPDTGDAQGQVLNRDHLRRLLMPLSRRERAVLVMRFFWDLSEQQTAEELGWPLGSVKSTTARALAKVRTANSVPDDAGRPVARGVEE